MGTEEACWLVGYIVVLGELAGTGPFVVAESPNVRIVGHFLWAGLFHFSTGGGRVTDDLSLRWAPSMHLPSPPAVTWWPSPEPPSLVYFLQRANLSVAGLGRPCDWGLREQGWDLTASSAGFQPTPVFSFTLKSVSTALPEPFRGSEAQMQSPPLASSDGRLVSAHSPLLSLFPFCHPLSTLLCSALPFIVLGKTKVNAAIWLVLFDQ